MSRSGRESITLPTGAAPEPVLYHAGDVWITDTRLVFGGRTYRFSDVRSLDIVSLSNATVPS